jgi:hypothetical protein
MLEISCVAEQLVASQKRTQLHGVRYYKSAYHKTIGCPSCHGYKCYQDKLLEHCFPVAFDETVYIILTRQHRFSQLYILSEASMRRVYTTLFLWWVEYHAQVLLYVYVWQMAQLTADTFGFAIRDCSSSELVEGDK